MYIRFHFEKHVKLSFFPSKCEAAYFIKKLKLTLRDS